MLSLKSYPIQILPKFTYITFYISGDKIYTSSDQSIDESNAWFNSMYTNPSLPFLIQTKVLSNNTPQLITDIISIKCEYSDWQSYFIQVVNFMNSSGYQFNDKLNAFQQEYKNTYIDSALTGKRLTYDSKRLIEYN